MVAMNKVVLAGRLTRDPEVRSVPSGTSVADIGIAVNERHKTKDGEWEDRPVFVDAVCWGKQADAVGKYLKKGSGILVDGALQLDVWKTKEGERRSRLRVHCNQVQFLGSREEGSQGNSVTRGEKR